MTEPIVPPEKPTRMIPIPGKDDGYDWDRPDVFPAEPEEPEPARANYNFPFPEPPWPERRAA